MTSPTAPVDTQTKHTPTPGPWHTGGIFNPDSARPTLNIWGPTAPGMQSGELIARDVTFKNAPLLLAAPDLLEALRAARFEFWQTWHANMSEEEFDTAPIIRQIDAAIDAARHPVKTI